MNTQPTEATAANLATLAPYSLGLSTVATTKNGHPVTREGNGSAWITRFICDQCHEQREHVSPFSSGYANSKEDEYICFDCMGKNDARDLASLPIGGRTCMYLTTEQAAKANNWQRSTRGSLSNWPGSFKIEHLHVTTGRHNIAGRRYDLRFIFQGKNYSGTQYGDNTQICHIRRLKS